MLPKKVNFSYSDGILSVCDILIFPSNIGASYFKLVKENVLFECR